jgi:glycine/D-amino acid oxidase-like deaminating enzyme
MGADGQHIIVVGAGIVGASIAEALAMDGWRVTVLDASTAGGGATAAGMGHIVVLDDSEAQIALTSYSQALWDARAAAGGIPKGGERLGCGTLWVAADDEEMTEVHRKKAFYAARGVSTEVLDARQLRAAEPHLREGLAGGLVVSSDSVVYPPPIAAAMVEEVKRRGGAERLSTKVERITGREVTLAGGERLGGDYVVNATGAAAATLTPDCNVRPRKGHLVITDRYPGFVRHQLVELGYLKSAHSSSGSSVAFNVQPRPTGQVLIGSSRQFGDDSRDIDHEILQKMLARAIEYMPDVAKLSAIRAWTGFRAATPDKLPLIGPHPDDERLILATGHEGLGITTSLGTARLVADTLAGRATEIPIGPYLPARLRGGAAAHGH